MFKLFESAQAYLRFGFTHTLHVTTVWQHLYCTPKRFIKVFYSPIDTLKGGCCHARHCQHHWQQLGKSVVPKNTTNNKLGCRKNWTANLFIIGQHTLSSMPQSTVSMRKLQSVHRHPTVQTHARLPMSIVVLFHRGAAMNWCVNGKTQLCPCPMATPADPFVPKCRKKWVLKMDGWTSNFYHSMLENLIGTKYYCDSYHTCVNFHCTFRNNGAMLRISLTREPDGNSWHTVLHLTVIQTHCSIILD